MNNTIAPVEATTITLGTRKPEELTVEECIQIAKIIHVRPATAAKWKVDGSNPFFFVLTKRYTDKIITIDKQDGEISVYEEDFKTLMPVSNHHEATLYMLRQGFAIGVPPF